jgi:hypothetical protein
VPDVAVYLLAVQWKLEFLILLQFGHYQLNQVLHALQNPKSPILMI